VSKNALVDARSRVASSSMPNTWKLVWVRFSCGHKEEGHNKYGWAQRELSWGWVQREVTSVTSEGRHRAES
jgi:hypothetical protein